MTTRLRHLHHGTRDAALRRLAPLPGAGRPVPVPALEVAAVVGLQLAAYLLVLLPMSFGFNRFAGLELVKYQLISVSNAVAAPAVLLLLVMLTRSCTVVVAFHVLQLAAFLAVSLYVGYFEAFPHISLLRQITLLPPVAGQILHQFVGLRELALVVLLLLSCGLACHLARRLRGGRSSRRWVAVLAAVLLVVAAKDALLHSRLPLWKYRYDGIYLFKRHGFVPIFAAQLLDELGPRPPAVPWPGPLNADGCRQRTFPPVRPDIFIAQVESLDPWVIEYEHEGQPVMPFVRELRHRALVFPNFFSQHRGGGTADAELACLAGLLPLGSHSGFLTADYASIVSLPHILATAGYFTCAMHANAGSYFYRNVAFRRLGFHEFFDRSAYTGEAAGWYSRDLAFVAQSLAILDRLPRPVFAYLITMQSHGPFDNHAPTNRFASESDPLRRDYLAVMAEVDMALAELAQGLDRRGRWANAVVAIFGDHQSGVAPPSGAGSSEGGARDRIPLLVCAPGLEPGTSPKVGSPLDLGPTLLHLIGAPPIAYSLGTSLLDEGVGRVLLAANGTLVLLRNREPGSPDLVVEHDLARYRPFLDYSERVLRP